MVRNRTIWRKGNRKLIATITKAKKRYPVALTIWLLSPDHGPYSRYHGDPVYLMESDTILTAIPSLTEWIEDEANGQEMDVAELRKKVLGGEYGERLGELADWMATDHLDNHMLRERELQIKYDLTVYVSEIAAARELGMSNAQVARRAGISPQAASNALAKARAKGVCLWEW